MPRVAGAKKTARPKKTYVSRATASSSRAVARKSTAPKRRLKYPGAGQRIGGAIGSMFGPVGSLVGGAVGNLAHNALNALTGYGDYTVKANALIETNGPPQIINRSNKEFVVRHREYITDVFSASGTANTPSTFGLLSYSINPGDSTTFPWLSSIADKFEQYRIEGMVFEYKSLYSDAVVTQNGSIGSIVLATEYNAGAPSFTSKQAMENYQFAQSCKPSMSVVHPVECARSQNVLSELYIRPGQVPAGEDVKTYDFGDFQIASQGIPLGAAGAAVNLGELWVSYQIALIKPRIPTASSTYKDSGFAYFTAFVDNAGFNPWGSQPVPTNGIVKRSISNLDVDLISDNTFRIKCLSTPMAYQVDLYWYSLAAPGAAVWRGPALTLSNCTFQNNTSSGVYQKNVYPLNLAAGSACNSHAFIIVPAATPSAQFATILVQTGTFGVDQTVTVRFEGFINAVPYPLT